MTRCKRCNKPLTDPTSIALALGPECRNKRQRRIAKRIAFNNGETITIGKTQVTTFSQLPSGDWTDGNTTYTHNYLETYLETVGVISTQAAAKKEVAATIVTA